MVDCVQLVHVVGCEGEIRADFGTEEQSATIKEVFERDVNGLDTSTT